jgi:Arc/MetJ family transcription regulator
MMGMRTNIELDDAVLKEAQHLTGLTTKREVVDFALRELVARNKRQGILKLKGRIHWIGDLDEMRRGRAWS